MLFQSSFGVPFNPVLCDVPRIGACLGIGVDASFWVGSFGGIRDGVALLTNAQLFANMGKPVDGIRPLVRIPIRQITFVSHNGEKCERAESDHKNDRDDNDHGR